MKSSGLATKHAPSWSLIRAHFGAGLAGLIVFAFALLWRTRDLDGHFFQPPLLGLVHLCVLGWFMPITIGAMHQLLPVVFEVPVRSERIAWIAFGLYVPSATGLIAHMSLFATGSGLVWSAAFLVLSFVLYIANLMATLARAPAVPLVGGYVIAAMLYLLVAASLGLALAWNLHAPYLQGDHLELLRAHAHAAGLGFFGLLIMGVAYRLIEMFLLAHIDDTRPGWVALAAMNVAIPALIMSFALGRIPGLTAVAIASLVVGVIGFLEQVRRQWRARMRKRTDVAWRHSLASFTYLVLSVGIGIVLLVGDAGALEPRLRLAYGFVALVGFIGSIIIGQLYKIVPFLIWFHRFSPYVGLKKVPAASELLPERPQRLHWALAHAGIAAFVVGILVGNNALRILGAALFAGSAVVFTRNMWVIVRSRP